MIRLSEKEKQMFLKIGLSERMFDFCVIIDQLYNMAVYCVGETKQESVVADSLMRCMEAMRNGVSRHTPEFESLIILDTPAVVYTPNAVTYYEKSKLTRAAKEAAQAEAEIRDKAKAHGVLQVSPRRYAVVHQHSYAWTAMPDHDESDAEGWLVRFDYSFAQDYDGNDLKNLSWQDAVAWYERLVRKTNITET